jgi:hypothetical protein
VSVSQSVYQSPDFAVLLTYPPIILTQTYFLSSSTLPISLPSDSFPFHVSSIYITFLLYTNSISVNVVVPTTPYNLYTLHFHCHCFPCQSRLQPAISSFATLTHSLCVPVTNRLLVILALPRTAIARTKSGTGYRRAHTLSRSLRDRQLATTCHTPPPTLLGLATVQNEKSHIPPRQAVTHLNASRLAP